MSDETVGSLGEKALLRRLRSHVAERAGIVRAFSEDCVVLDSGAGLYRLLTMDVLVEGVHFRREWATAHDIGRKAVNVNVSDVSAMGGRARRFLISLGLPRDTPGAFVDALYEGVASAARQSDLALAGGNLSSSPVLFLDIAMEGDVDKELVLMRNGARPGDSIFVTGLLGAAAAGLRFLQQGFHPGDLGALPVTVRDAIRAHLDPPVLQATASWLASSRCVSAMMDLSDGLASDLPEICRESRLGAVVEAASIPVAECIRDEKDSLKLALCGGEDYHLLFTVASGRREEFLRLCNESGITMHEIGAMVPEEQGILLHQLDGHYRTLDAGFEHFGKTT